MRHLQLPAQILAVAALVIAGIGPASAYDTSASGGLFIQRSGDTTGGVIVTQHLRSRALHVNGFRSQVSLAVPFATGGRYAATAEVRHGFAGTTYAGAGLGYGKWDRNGSHGALYNVLAGTRIAHHTYLEGRFYNPISSNVGHTGFVGVTYFF